MTLSRTDIFRIGIVAAVLTAVALAAANFVGDEPDGNGGGAEYAVTLAGSLLLAVALFGWVIPRAKHPARTGLIVGLLGVLALAAFWSGLPFVLGPAAIALGLLGRGATGARGQGTIAVALGALATLGALAAVILDQTM